VRAAKVDELNGTVEVRDDGSIELPLVGVVQAAGRTEAELVADLQERLSAYVREPHVDLSRAHHAKPAPPAAAAPNPPPAPEPEASVAAASAPAAAPEARAPVGGTYSVEGWVSRPGEYPLKGHTTLSSAVAEAGGASVSARVDEVEIEHPPGSSEARHEIVNLAKITEKGGTDVPIHAGDIVRVPGPAFLSFPWTVVRIITFPFWYPFS